MKKMSRKNKSLSINSVVGWSKDIDKGGTPKEIGVVLELDVRIEGNTYEFVKVLWNTGNVANVPVDLVREVITS